MIYTVENKYIYKVEGVKCVMRVGRRYLIIRSETKQAVAIIYTSHNLPTVQLYYIYIKI
jgi:hypothetical protein